MKLKHIAAAVALAAAGSTAQAATVPSDGLFISIWDQTDQSSFFGNLGVTTGAFNTNGSYSASGDLLSDLSAWLGAKTNLSGITWNVLGTRASPLGGLTTVKTLNSVTDTRQGPVAAGASQINTFIGQRNLDLASSDGAAYTQQTFIQDFGNVSIGIDSNGLLGETLAFYELLQGTRTAQGQINPLAGNWTLSYGTSGASLTYAAATAVPVPAAAWLLGSALLGMVGIGRRKKA